MSVRKKLKFLILPSVTLLLTLATNAAVGGDGDADASDSTTVTATSTLGNDPTNCIDLNADCSTLMVNYHGESVEFALFRRGSLKDTSYEVDSTDYDPSNDQAYATKNLPSGDSSKSDSSEQSLGVDFLRGLEAKGDDPALKGEFSGKEDSSAGADGIHDWAFAAATFIENNSRHSNPDDVTVPINFGEGSLTFWDFERVYEWEVDENVLDRGRYDSSQVTLSTTYLSPKKIATSDPEIVICDQNDPTNCRPLSD